MKDHGNNSAAVVSRTPLVRHFFWLLENDFLSMEGAGVSRRTDQGFEYVGEWSALDEEFSVEAPVRRRDREDLYTVHAGIYAVASEVSAVISGFPAHLEALRAQGLPWPPPTKTMEKRNVFDLGSHSYGAEELEEHNLPHAVSKAQKAAETAGMDHLLILRDDGLLCIGAGILSEAMVHYQNVVICSQVEYLRMEEESPLIARYMPT